MERRRAQSDGRMWSTRWRLGRQSSLETGCRKTLPYVIERLHTYTHIYTYIHTHTYIYIYMHTYVRTYIHTYTHVHTHIHAYVRTYVHTYIHTYIHTSTRCHETEEHRHRSEKLKSHESKTDFFLANIGVSVGFISTKHTIHSHTRACKVEG
jgi:hypothetical protein